MKSRRIADGLFFRRELPKWSGTAGEYNRSSPSGGEHLSLTREVSPRKSIWIRSLSRNHRDG